MIPNNFEGLIFSQANVHPGGRKKSCEQSPKITFAYHRGQRERCDSGDTWLFTMIFHRLVCAGCQSDCCVYTLNFRYDHRKCSDVQLPLGCVCEGPFNLKYLFTFLRFPDRGSRSAVSRSGQVRPLILQADGPAFPGKSQEGRYSGIVTGSDNVPLSCNALSGYSL